MLYNNLIGCNMYNSDECREAKLKKKYIYI